jgi:hypothetical protein
MECDQARGKLLEFREGQLDLDARMRMEAHLLVCGECLDELQAVESVLASVAALPVPEPSPGFPRRIHARIQEERRRRPARERGRLPCVASLAAAGLAGLLLVSGGLWALFPLRGAPPSQVSQARTTVEELSVWSFLLRSAGEDAELLLHLWPGRASDLSVLAEGGDRALASLALGAGGPDVEEMVRLFTAALSEGKAADSLAGTMELSDQELEELLARLRKG